MSLGCCQTQNWSFFPFWCTDINFLDQCPLLLNINKTKQKNNTSLVAWKTCLLKAVVFCMLKVRKDNNLNCEMIGIVIHRVLSRHIEDKFNFVSVEKVEKFFKQALKNSCRCVWKAFRFFQLCLISVKQKILSFAIYILVSLCFFVLFPKVERDFKNTICCLNYVQWHDKYCVTFKPI